MESQIIGSKLYRRNMEWASKWRDGGRLEHKVWDGTPWMVNCKTGSISNHGRYREIMDWCSETFGPEAWPIHGNPGDWHSGGTTVHGWTWMGFATEEMMGQFCDRWECETH